MNTLDIINKAVKSATLDGREVFINAETNNSLDDSWDIALAVIHDGATESFKREPIGSIIERLEGAEIMSHLTLVDSDESSSAAFYKVH